MNPTIPPFVVTENKSFVRDTKNRALLRTDRALLERHRAIRLKDITLTQKIHTMERELTDLKAIVQRLLERGT